MQKIIFLTFCSFLLLTLAHAQQGDIYFEDYTYKTNIKTVVFHQSNRQTSLPIIKIGQSLYFSFDDLEGGYKNYIYEVIHCDRNWNPSKIDVDEYMKNFNDHEIEISETSRGTIVDYTNYQLTIPNQYVRWTISGNYILAVYHEDTLDPIITKRFVVTEDRVNVEWELKKSRQPGQYNSHLEIQYAIDKNKFRMSDPSKEISATVLQNGNWYTGFYNQRTTSTIGEKVQFDLFKKPNFAALKEFRSFDIRTIKSSGLNVHSLDRYKTRTDVLLHLEDVRNGRNYLFEEDANGSFVIDNYDYDGDVALNSDYANVIFTLEKAYPIEDKEVYVIGQFSDWQAYDEYRMDYDEERGIYINTSKFKQGYYNYMFGVDMGNTVIDFTELEGSWYETENSYTIIIYFQEFGSRYDRVIAVQNF